MSGDRFYDVVALIAWSHEQLDAEERIAQAATPGPWHPDGHSVMHSGPSTSQSNERWGLYVAPSVGAYDVDHPTGADAEHIARQDPTHTLAGTAAHRAILDRLTTWVEEERAARDDYAAWAAGDRSPAGLPQRTVPHQEGPGLEYAARAMASRFADRDGYRAEWKP